MNSKKYEIRPISLIDLFWHIVMGWRYLLVWAVIFIILATVFAGVKCSKAKQNYQSEMDAYQAALAGEVETETDDADVQLTKEELQQIQDVVALQKMVTKSRNYISDSILMNVDPYAENKLTVTFFVDSDYTYNYTGENTLDYTDSLVSGYANLVYSGKLAEQLKKSLNLNCDIEYVQELLSVSRDDKNLSVMMIYKDDKIFEAASMEIQRFIEKHTDELTKRYGSHELKFVSEQESVVSDADTASLQANAINNLNNYRSQYNGLKAGLTEAQLNKLGIEVKKATVESEELEQDELEEELVEPVYPSFDKKYPILGFIGGIFLACVWLAMVYIFNNKLERSHELTEYFDLKHVGTVFHDKKRKGLDAFLWKCRMRNQKTMDYDTSLELVCSNVELMCQKAESKTICLTGTEIEKLEDAETIAKKLEKAGIIVHVCGDVCYDQKAMRKIADTGVVVVLEQVGVSIYKEIDRQLERLNQSGIQVLGAIGVE